MFRTEKPWLQVYGERVEPETEVFEGSLYDLFRDALPKSTVGKLLRRVLAAEERERAGMGTPSATGTAPPPSPS